MLGYRESRSMPLFEVPRFPGLLPTLPPELLLPGFRTVDDPLPEVTREFLLPSIVAVRPERLITLGVVVVRVFRSVLLPVMELVWPERLLLEPEVVVVRLFRSVLLPVLVVIRLGRLLEPEEVTERLLEFPEAVVVRLLLVVGVVVGLVLGLTLV